MHSPNLNPEHPTPQAEHTPERTHVLKTDPIVFDAVASGLKSFEIRFDDRGYAVGDVLHLRRTDYTGAEMRDGSPLRYSGDLLVEVTYILRGPIYGLAEGWVIMGIRALAGKDPSAVQEAPAYLEVLSSLNSQKWYLTSCEKCGWLGSSEQCGQVKYGDDADVSCPECGEIIAAEELTPQEFAAAALAKLGGKA